MSEDDFRRSDEDLDRELQRREARDRCELAEGQTELREFRGGTARACPVNAALAGWLKAMDASAWAYAPIERRSEIVAADPLGSRTKRRAA